LKKIHKAASWYLYLTGASLFSFLCGRWRTFPPQLREAGMEIQLSYQEEKAMILSDGDELMRVLENFLSNAIRYGKNGKFVNVTVRLNSEHVSLQVMNYGPSIPSSYVPYILERFYRA
jgi:signal transduction histidine kinase